MTDGGDFRSAVAKGPSGVVGVFGATSLVGTCLLSLLSTEGWQVKAFSRQKVAPEGNGVEWLKLIPGQLSDDRSAAYSVNADGTVPYWIFASPIWVVPDYFALLEARSAKRIVVLSSTSRFTKNDSTDPEEQEMAARLGDAEARVREWAESLGIEWVILRPTLIYGLGQDKNIAEIARFIRRFGFFPVFGKANGLRQPIHAMDVAGACLAALQSSSAANRMYNISGGETLAYRDMVSRVFAALDRRPRMLMVPLWSFRMAVALLHCLPRYRHWSSAMAERMNRDMVFDRAEAERDLDFKPRPFELSASDLPA
jgi:nucleoside-diphosphate-sugar epimerase